ncbi:uncharacterized protein ACA1_019010 [Acanthamoeba castellanii str. Neff]|uniref:Uncharacterized protein n=1 Tax=Acanthamoeba castellanii (strain ATCC 30010 / Neff) TaxID=1257118 RepID=L8HJH8_ACACF|nr:uncharacterized protein ACA1_019010 [Acanthamoeba castellanii str. Neff]ELR25749.1 hypothetical protein ACA1_019010 [Acanthamoeba castellanii str. Neff]
MSDEEQLQAPTHKKATKVGGRRVGQDKAHHHASSEQQKSTARSIVADSLNAAPDLELTPTQKEEEKLARLSQSPQKEKMCYPQGQPTREKPHHKQGATHSNPVIHQPTRGV